MFRGCYFEFAGKSSEVYDLMLYYIENKSDNFNSGGEYELQKDTIPHSYEEFLYGKNYSEKALDFQVEITIQEGNISFERMFEIKNWLFGQEGWKELTISDDTQKYHLKCVLIPSEDITDVNGYIGVRCTIHNASPFWYGDEKEIVFEHDELMENRVTVTENSNPIQYGVINIHIPENEYAVNEFQPKLIFRDARAEYGNYSGNDQTQKLASSLSPKKDTLDNICGIALVDASSLSSSKSVASNSFVRKNKNAIWYKTPYLAVEPTFNSGNGYFWSSSSANDTITVNSKFATASGSLATNKPTIYAEVGKIVPTFVLNSGDNYCRVRHPSCLLSLTVKYTPMYRMGAF